MYLHDQRGAISLLWAAVFVGAVTLVAIVALMSARHERNYFAVAWKHVTNSTGQKLQQAAENALSPGSADVRKCMIAGQVVYSNVECDKANPTSQDVALQETKGFEAPKPLQAPAMQANKSPQDKAIERVLDH